MTRFAAILCTTAIMLMPDVATAGEIADLGTKADGHVAAGNFVEATTALDAAQDSVWKLSPLLFRRALFTAGEPSGFGLYDLREGSTFKRSEPLIIYSEPMGYGYGREGSLYLIDLDLDFTIKRPDGSVVASQNDFGSLSFRSRFPNKEFMAKVTYDFSGLPAGDYAVTTIARDRHSDKTGEFTLSFTLVE